MKKIVALFMAVMMVFGLTACGGSTTSSTTDSSTTDSSDTSSSSSSDITVGVVLKTLSSEYWGYVEAGAKAAGEELGVKVDIVGPASETSYDEQNSEIENYISSGSYDAIAIAPLQPDSISTVIGETDIPILFLDTDAEYTDKVAYIGTGNYDAAYMGGEYAATESEDAKTAVIIAGVQGNTTSDERENGYKDALEKAGIEVASIQYAEATADKATEKMENMLTSLNNDIDIVCCTNDDMAAGAANACKQAGVDDVTIVGFDGIQTGVQNVIDGVITATVAQSPYNMGYQAVENAIKAAKGEKVEATIDTGSEVITSENAEEYLATLKEMLGE